VVLTWLFACGIIGLRRDDVPLSEGDVMDQRELVAQGRLCDANWELELHMGLGAVVGSPHYKRLVRDVELAELRLRAVLGNIDQKARV